MAQKVVIPGNLTQLKKMTDQLPMPVLIHNRKLALENLYDKYAAEMYGLICSLTEDKILAENIFEAIFIQLSNEETLSTFENLVFTDIMKFTYSLTIKRLYDNPDTATLHTGKQSTIMHFLCLKCTSAADVAYILDVPQPEVKMRLRTESLRLRQLEI